MKYGLTSNSLKIIAIILMVIDHIGLYMYNRLQPNTYYLFRSIGRLAMPIFVYLIIQGFFYTKNLKKYIFRIFILATITQIMLFITGYINEIYYPNYIVGVNKYLGVLYSYALSLVLIAIIDRKRVIPNFSENVNLVIRINIFILIELIYLKFRIEFDLRIPFMFLELYAIEKVFKKDNMLFLKQNLKDKWNKVKSKSLYISLIFITFALSLCFVEYSSGCKYAVLASIIPIILYNGKKEKNNKFIRIMFYAIFQIQHIILYWIGMVNI